MAVACRSSSEADRNTGTSVAVAARCSRYSLVTEERRRSGDRTCGASVGILMTCEQECHGYRTRTWKTTTLSERNDAVRNENESSSIYPEVNQLTSGSVSSRPRANTVSLLQRHHADAQ